MGDARRIDHLRALALSSMPSLAKRPVQRRNSGTIETFDQRKAFFSALPVVQDDKEEGELSSDDELERTATPPVAVESSLSSSHRNAGQSFRAPTQGKDRRHPSAATSAESVPVIGVSSASVLPTSTRVSIVNKSQLFSAFTAQAPPLISSQTPAAVQNGSVVGIAVSQPEHPLPEVTSSGSLLDNSVPNLYHGAPGSSLRASTTATSQLIPTPPNLTPPNLTRSQASGNARIGETITQHSSLGRHSGSQIHAPVLSSISPSIEFPDLSTAVSLTARAVSPVPLSVNAIGVPESIGGTLGPASVVIGADVSIASGAGPAVSGFATPVIGSVGVCKETGVRKEAEAFLASLRIPLVNSAASCDEKEDSFLIKFDEDSDSDGENENGANHTRRGSRKGTIPSAGLVTPSVPPQSSTVMPTQSPSDLTAEIDRMKEKIAAMERTKVKTSISSVPGKAGRVLSTDTPRNLLLPATGNVRPASVDLESMRIKIAAKECELQQRRQRLAVKIPESGRGLSDLKRTGGVLTSSLRPTIRHSQAADSAAAYASNPIGKSSSGKGISGFKKDAGMPAGIPALALAGPAGANLAAFKRDVEQRVLDGCNDHQHLNGPVSNFPTVQVGSHVSRVIGQQLSGPKGMKRSRIEEEIGELAKVPKFDSNAVAETTFTEDSSKEAGSMNDTLKGGRSLLSPSQAPKRKLDAGQLSSDRAVLGSLLDSVSAARSDCLKKLKSSGEWRIGAHRKDQHGAQSNVILSNIFPRETRKSPLKTTTGSIPVVVDGNIVIRDVEPAASLSAPLPVMTECQRNSHDLQTSFNVIQTFGTNGNAEAPMVKTRDIEQSAIFTTVAVTECQQGAVGRLNPSSTFSFENNTVHTGQPLGNPVASTHLDYQVEHSSHPGHSRIDNQHLDEEHFAFQQLLEEEELLDKQLEEVQRNRQRCEVRERIARREYREAQWALRAANEDCFALNQRKEFLLSRVHAAEARHLPDKSYVDRPLVPFGGTVVTHNQIRHPEHVPFVSAPYLLPVGQTLEATWEEDVNAGHGRSAIIRESLSPFSSNKVGLGAVAHRDATTVVSTEEGEENFRYKLVKSISSDDKEYESHGQLMAGLESSGRLENYSSVGEMKEQTGFANVESQEEDLEPGILVDDASQAGNNSFTHCESDLNHNELHTSPFAGLDNSGLGVSKFAAKRQTSTLRTDDLPQETLVEESEKLPLTSLALITVECSEKPVRPSTVDDINTDVCTEDERHPALDQGPRLDPPEVMGEDLEQEGFDNEHHDVKQITASSSSQDAQSVDSLQSAPDLVPDLDTNYVHESVNMEDVNLTVDDTRQDDFTGNVSPGTHEEDVVLEHLEDSSIRASAMEFANIDSVVKAGTEDLYDASLSAECAGQVLPERSCAVQETFLEVEAKGVESCADSRGYAEDVASEGEAIACSFPHNLEEVNEARDGAERRNMESLVEVPDDSVLLMTEPQQCISHLPLLAFGLLDEKEANPSNDDLTPIENSDMAFSNVEEEAPVVCGYSSGNEAPPHPNGWTADIIDESSEHRVSDTQLHSYGATEKFIALDLETQHVKDVASQEGVPGVHQAGEVGRPNGASGRENSSAPEPGSLVLNLHEESADGVATEDSVGIPSAELTDPISDNCLTEQSPTTVNDVGHDTLILENQYCQPSSEERDPLFDNPFVTQFADPVNLDNTGLQEHSDTLEEEHRETCMLEEEHRETSEVPQQPSAKKLFDDNSHTEGVDHKKQGPDQDGDVDTSRIIESDIITDNSEAQMKDEFGSQDYDPAIAMLFEDQQQDQLDVDMAESGEKKQEEPEKKESKGADVEVFRKALLDGNIFERRSSSGEVVETENLRKQIRDEVSTQILPQLQHHRLEHLLDMVEVRVPELSLGGDIPVPKNLQGTKDSDSPVAIDDMQLDTPVPESRDVVVQSAEQALSSRTTLEKVSATAKHWVPSADSLAVLRFIPRIVVPPSESDSGREMERGPSELGSKVSFEPSVVPLDRYESPLSIFRSYRISPQFSDDFHLSRGSMTWNHAINPFKPLCKFEHRGKCNNDDCPWQHADDYTLSPSQVLSQMQNYVEPRGRTSVDHDVDVAESQAGRIKSPLSSPRKNFAKSSSGHVSSPLKWNDCEVPIYRTGSYTLRAEEPMRMFLPSHNLQLDRKVGNLHSFLLSPSIHRPLPPDIPCLLDASETSSWFAEPPAYHPGSPHERYIRDIQEKLMCTTKDGGDLQELVDEEMWLELALHHIDYDITTDNNKARDQALFYLARALESKQSSVILWVVYSCLFHMRKDNPETDDMFHHAVQYNPGSYELWVLYITSRSDFQSRLDAHEKAIVALADEGTRLLLDTEELSAFMLDIGLRMLYFWCVSGHPEDSSLWVDDLICEASAQDDDVRPDRGSTRALLSHLTQHDACVLWIACTYLLACKHLPGSIIRRFGCKQELPDGLEWAKHAKLDEVTRKCVMKALSTAASDGLGCLSLGSAQALTEKDNCSRQVLGVNYIQCLSLYEGLESAACLGTKLINLHPTSLELIVLCARIDEHREGFTAGLHIFDEAVSRWPRDLLGMQQLWNQYAGHSLQWGGKDLAKTVLLNCAATKRLPTKIPVSVTGSDKTERTDDEGNTDVGWSHLREYFVTLTSVGKRSDGGAISSQQLYQVEDTVYALINLALVEGLSGEFAASQSAINSAMKAAVSRKDLRHCWRELAGFQQVFSSRSAGGGIGQMLEHGMLSLLDRCKTDSYNMSQLRPLSEKAFQNYKKPHVLKFLEELIAPPPLDHSVLNSILGTLYGPQLLPSTDSYPLKEVFHFAEGILEALPGNVQLASSLCTIVGQNMGALKGMYMSVVMWASALLLSALYQSCPVAPEAYWMEAGSLLRQLDEGRSLEEFYKVAVVKYPFSAALCRCLQEVQERIQVSETLSQVQHTSLPAVAAEPMQVAVEH